MPLSAPARELLQGWLRVRPDGSSSALFVNPGGDRLSVRAIDRGVRAVGELAGVALSAHVLRHTFVTLSFRSGVDVVMVAELAGHRSLETTRRYSLPTEADREAAVELAAVTS